MTSHFLYLVVSKSWPLLIVAWLHAETLWLNGSRKSPLFDKPGRPIHDVHGGLGNRTLKSKHLLQAGSDSNLLKILDFIF